MSALLEGRQIGTSGQNDIPQPLTIDLLCAQHNSYVIVIGIRAVKTETAKYLVLYRKLSRQADIRPVRQIPSTINPTSIFEVFLPF